MKNLHLQFVRHKPILLNNFTPLNLVGKHGVWRLGFVRKREKIFHFRISARRATIRHATRIVFTIPLSPMSVLPERSLILFSLYPYWQKLFLYFVIFRILKFQMISLYSSFTVRLTIQGRISCHVMTHKVRIPAHTKIHHNILDNIITTDCYTYKSITI